jgi:hypothetical protein
MCYNYPIEQLARSAESRVQIGFARMRTDLSREPIARRALPHETVGAHPEMRQDDQCADTAAAAAGRP